MVKRTVEVSSGPTYLSTKRGQLIVRRDGELVGEIPFEDLGTIVVDNPATTYSHAALCGCLDAGASLLLCGSNHLPKGMLLPFGEHTEVRTRVELQLAASQPQKKRLWKQLVQAKIVAQASNLGDTHVAQKLRRYADEVRSGDTTNREAVAARVYWATWLTSDDDESEQLEGDRFRRSVDGGSPNPLLNYGYAVLRACVARSIVAAGFLPVLGIQHSNRSNAFALADDLMEPLRPIVDSIVRRLVRDGETEINRATKESLLGVLTASVKTTGVEGPLPVGVERMVASFAHCLERTQKQLEIPVQCN